jgi:hypothetical protein
VRHVRFSCGGFADDDKAIETKRRNENTSQARLQKNGKQIAKETCYFLEGFVGTGAR